MRSFLPKRSIAALVAIGASVALVMTGCSSSGSSTDDASSGPVTLSFWAWVPGIEDAVDLWNSENPNIQVELNRIASGDSVKIPAAVDAGTGPDIAQFSQHSLADYVIKGQAIDISEYVASTEDLFTASSWSAVTFGDKVYGVPQDSGPGALMYRSDLFAQYGIEPPVTWEDYEAAAKTIHEADPSVYLGQFSPNEVGLFYPDMVQAGGSWFGTDGDSWTVEVNNEASTGVAERYQSLLDQDLLKVEQMWTPEYWKDVNDGKIASINYAAWFPTILADNASGLAGKWAVAPSPTDNGDAGDGGGSVNAVMKGTKHPEAAAEFITWLNSDPASLDILISEGGLFPSALAGQESDTLLQPSDYFGGQVINEVFADAAKNVPTTNVEGPNYSATQGELTDAFAQVAESTLTMSEALDQIQAATVDDLTAAGLSVK